ncbi:MAG: NAD(P)H-hydrate dehydratase [Xanthomonadales bacterium]|nr:NAD(P)H-hydrate dehydratase [Xanthomonadales bacterium]NNL95778.1 NAD(P)H-hydrate dehydratase [Xanthomonadales bacterium]
MGTGLTKLYTAEQVRRLDSLAIGEAGIEGFELMSRAARAVFERSNAAFPDSRHWLVLCGAGNNAGDGYLVACNAKKAGLQAQVLWLTEPEKLHGDAARAAAQWKTSGGESFAWDERGRMGECDLLLDGLLGTGLDRPLEGDYRAAVEWMNTQDCSRVAIDIPTGLHADTGNVLGAATLADMTVTFIGRKRGQFTADGPDHCGQLIFDSLDVPQKILNSVDNSGILIGEKFIRENLPPRRRNSNKGQYGHILVCGGGPGMGGAVRLAGEAALRSGAGLVSVATDGQHAMTVWSGCPELMVSAVSENTHLQSLAEKASVIAVGPGLGESQWSQDMLAACMATGLPLVVDADGLNLLAANPCRRDNWVLTPHPGEAARLLGTDTSQIQRDRVTAACEIAEKFNAVVVLKGCGTVVAQAGGPYSICPLGNAGMATAGAGDVLTGVVAGLWGQGLNAMTAAQLGVAVHAAAGDEAMRRRGQMSMLAGDISRQLHRVLA